MKKTLILFFLNMANIFCENILYISVIPSLSHQIWNRVLVDGLLKRGHNVTLFDLEVEKIKRPNYTHILAENVYEERSKYLDVLQLAEENQFQCVQKIGYFGINNCRLVLKTQGLKKILNYPADSKFHIIVIEVTAGSCLYPLIHKFNYPPTVGVTPFPLASFFNYNFGNALQPTYVPFHGYPYTKKMSFMERLWNYIITYYDLVHNSWHFYKEQDLEAKKVFGEDIPSSQELERHISLLITNTDPILEYPQSLPPNIIAAGGLHTKPAKKLPKDLQVILDEATKGAIVFSLGTNVLPEMMNKKTLRSCLEAFGKLQQTVIWKFNGTIENLPKNLIIRKWLPQNDILGHPNVRLFIGHAGALSTQEAIYHGVPILCIPFYMDQIGNAKIVVDRKIGLSIEFRTLTTENFLTKIKEILNNPIYVRNIKEVSERFRGLKETPLERAVFWIEYVMRFGGRDFLSTGARDLSFYKVYGLDILAFFGLILLTVIFFVYKVFKIITILFKTQKKTKIN